MGLGGDQSCRQKTVGEDPGWARRRAGRSNAVVRQEIEAGAVGAPHPAWAPDTSSVEPLGLGLSLTTFLLDSIAAKFRSLPSCRDTVTPAVTEQWICCQDMDLVLITVSANTVNLLRELRVF